MKTAYESNRQMKAKLINIGVGTDILKNKEFFKNHTQRNREKNFKFPTIDAFKKLNEKKENYPNTNLSNLYRGKNKNYNSVGTKERSHNHFTNTTTSENDIPKITSKFSNSKINNFFPSTIKKKKQVFTTLKNNNYADSIYKSNAVLTTIKQPELNINSENNISNINNIYNAKDYLKYSFSHSSHKNNDSRNLFTIRNIKNSESNITLNEEDKQCILNLLEQKTVIYFNKRNKNKKNVKKIKKDEFKEFLKEILKQNKKKNINRVKKKNDIDALLKNKNHNYKKRTNKFDNVYQTAKTKYDSYKNDNRYKTIILKNEYLNSKLNNNLGMLTEDLNSKKRNVFNIYKFKKNKKILNEVEKNLIKIEGKIKESFDRFKKNINDEPTTFD
jgi:hypothetical protein